MEDFEYENINCIFNDSSSTTTVNPGLLNHRLNQLGCRYQGLQDQSERRNDEINAMMYVINDVAMNMNAAKTHITENQAKIRSLQNANDQPPPTETPSLLVINNPPHGGMNSNLSVEDQVTKLRNKI